MGGRRRIRSSVRPFVYPRQIRVDPLALSSIIARVFGGGPILVRTAAWEGIAAPLVVELERFPRGGELVEMSHVRRHRARLLTPRSEHGRRAEGRITQPCLLLRPCLLQLPCLGESRGRRTRRRRGRPAVALA